jgi:hypothetical protein
MDDDAQEGRKRSALGNLVVGGASTERGNEGKQTQISRTLKVRRTHPSWVDRTLQWELLWWIVNSVVKWSYHVYLLLLGLRRITDELVGIWVFPDSVLVVSVSCGYFLPCLRAASNARHRDGRSRYGWITPLSTLPVPQFRLSLLSYLQPHQGWVSANRGVRYGMLNFMSSFCTEGILCLRCYGWVLYFLYVLYCTLWLRTLLRFHQTSIYSRSAEHKHKHRAVSHHATLVTKKMYGCFSKALRHLIVQWLIWSLCENHTEYASSCHRT